MHSAVRHEDGIRERLRCRVEVVPVRGYLTGLFLTLNMHVHGPASTRSMQQLWSRHDHSGVVQARIAGDDVQDANICRRR